MTRLRLTRSRPTAVEVAPLSHRVLAMTAFRASLLVLGGVLLANSPQGLTATELLPIAGYAALSALAAAAVLLPSTRWVVRVFGISLLLDGVLLQAAHERLGHNTAVEALICASLMVSCLLGSYRTGVKLAVWQSMLMILSWRLEEARVFDTPAAMVGVNRGQAVWLDMAMLWTLVLAISTASAINERELRRRRQDAEALQVMAADLLAVDEPDGVVRRLAGFLTGELGLARAIVVERTPAAIRVLGNDVPTPRGADASSAILDLATQDGGVLVLRLDPRIDAHLAALLPGARRVGVVPMNTRGTFAVLEFAAGRFRFGRVERRMVSSASQAVSTAAIAFARAQLVSSVKHDAMHDALTTLANRRAFDTELDERLRTLTETGEGFALILGDVDHFKAVNDTHGHQVGDEVLAAVGRCLAGHASAVTFPARYGGEEFAVVVRRADLAHAHDLAEHLRSQVAALTEPLPITMSLGVAAFDAPMDGPAAVIEAADEALLRAKAQGRNRVVRSSVTVR